jgi:hypothetical protein
LGVRVWAHLRRDPDAIAVGRVDGLQLAGVYAAVHVFLEYPV